MYKEIYAIIELIKYGDYDESNAESKIIEIIFNKEKKKEKYNLLNKNKNKIIDNKWNKFHDKEWYDNYLEINYTVQELKIKM